MRSKPEEEESEIEDMVLVLPFHFNCLHFLLFRLVDV